MFTASKDQLLALTIYFYYWTLFCEDQAYLFQRPLQKPVCPLLYLMKTLR